MNNGIIEKRKDWEKDTIYKMIHLYCKKHHDAVNELCEECLELYNYSISRIDNCVHKIKKPVCSKCKVHCFNKEHRNKIRIVMRWSGPRMICHYPLRAFKYLFYKLRY
ncbi:MAG: nitrous oxide-stimulated promoter family protein [Bacteroidetes bacterium]|nr:nitrous oxide-stimulated promoter family protein [Bacteroidota bacterium]